MDTHPKRSPSASRAILPLGLDGLFRGIGQMLQLANHIAETAPEDESGAVEVSRTGSVGIPKAAQAVYGVSVRIGPRVAPPRRPFATLRQRAGKDPVIDDVREPAADVLDEGDHFLVVAELPGASEAEVTWQVRNERVLTIHAECADRKYHRDIAFAEPVDDRTALTSYANGILELRLWKPGLR